MKRVFCILMLVCLLACPALAQEENPFGPYVLTLPEGAALTEAEGTYTCVSGSARVVVMYISRVPDEDPETAVIRLMAQFDPDAALEEDLVLAPGYVGVQAVGTDRFGPEQDQLTMMILSDSGDLLILSGYDLNGDGEKAQALMEALAASVTVAGGKVAGE